MDAVSVVPYDEPVVSEPEPMDETQLQALVRSEIEDAANFVDNDLAPKRKKATDYYMGRPFGDEEEGRSQIVSQDTRDTVQAVLPSLMRIFTGPERVVEYEPVGPEDVPFAEQATDYVNHLFLQDNAGFTILYSAFKDALVRKTGIVKWWHEEEERVETYTYTDLGDGAFAAVVSRDDVEVVGHEERSVPTAQGVERSHDVTIRRRWLDKQIRVAAVPPEEFLIDRNARSLDDARLVAHRSKVKTSYLVAKGYSRDLVMDHVSHTDDLSYSEERRARQINSTWFNDDTDNDALAPVLYVEAYLRLDLDGTGIAELHKVCCIGEEYQVVNVEPVDEIPFADFCPDPEPHTFFGLSLHDIVEDIQRLKSQLWRAHNDSLVQAVFPRMGVVPGYVNMDDALSTEVGGIIRMTQPGMIQPIVTPYLGAPVLQALAHADEVKESRTGQNKSSLGLEADALQSTTRAAVQAQMQAAQQRIELIARIFAETGMRRLFKGLLKAVVRHQDRPRMVRLRNEWVAVDPLDWKADMDVRVNVALGLGSTEDRVMALMQIAAKQQEIWTQMGPQNGAVTMGQYLHTLRKATELMGHNDPSSFFNRLPLDYDPEPSPPPPDPNMELVKLEQQKAQIDAQMRQAELQQKQWEAQAKDDRERDWNEARVILEAAKLKVDHTEALARMEKARNG